MCAPWRFSRSISIEGDYTAFYRRQTLNCGGPRLADDVLLEGQHRQMRRERLDQLVGPQQEVRIARLAEAFVAEHEGFVEQHARRRERRHQIGKGRAVEIIGHDDAVIAVAQTPRFAIFDIERDSLACRMAGSGRLKRPDVAIDGDDAVAAGEQQAGVPAAAGGEIENTATGADQGRMTLNPWRWRRVEFGEWAH